MELFWHLMSRMSQVFFFALILPFLLACRLREWEPAGAILITGFLSAAAAWEFALRARRRERRGQMTLREGAMFMVLVWFLLGGLGMLPFLLSGMTQSIPAAFLESISALTTTGLPAATLTREGWPWSLLLWHSIMSWLGGFGFVVILVTVMPQVSGCFGVTLSARQMISFSPIWQRMRTSIRQGAALYVVLTLLAVLAFYLAGLPLGRSMVVAMLTISSGADAWTLDFASMPGSVWLAAGTVMLLGSLNLLLLWKSWKRRSLSLLVRDTELQFFLLMLLWATLLVVLNLSVSGFYQPVEALKMGFFQVLSFASTSGLAVTPFWEWPGFEKYVLLIMCFAGGCMGSPTGGLKMVRLLVLNRLLDLGLRNALHPNMVPVVKLDGLAVEEKVVGRMLSFFFLYILTFVFFALLLSITGISLLQSAGYAAACLTSNSSAALLYGGPGAAALPGWSQLLMALLMIVGRIEVFSFILLAGFTVESIKERW